MPNNKILLLQGSNVKSFDESGEIIEVPDQSEESFLTYGLNDLSSVDYSKIHNEFGDSVEVLYYTDDPDKTEAKLEITANYSPLDEIEGDFEVVTWTDESSASRTLNINAIPKPQFIKQLNPISLSGDISNLLATESGNQNKKYLLSDNKTTWKTWNGTEFVNASTQEESMTSSELASITKEQWKTFGGSNVYLGIYVDEGTNATSITYDQIAPKESTLISDARLYILNTVSTINVSFAGSTLTGILDDEDRGKVQYRAILNGANYYPKSGEFTSLSPAPLDIDITLNNTDYLIDEQNTLRVEFKDFWGTTDFWETTFIGAYSGILFTDVNGDYYSTDVGEVIKHLDFGIIVAGQTTTEQEIRLKNTYGYPVESVKVYTQANDLPNGMKAQFGSNLISFEATEELHLDGVLEDQEEIPFYIRLSTKLGTVPAKSGQFNIVVAADRVKPDITV